MKRRRSDAWTIVVGGKRVGATLTEQAAKRMAKAYEEVNRQAAAIRPPKTRHK